MRIRIAGAALSLGGLLCIPILMGSAQNELTYGKDIQPIIKKHCLPCHLSDNENPSGLEMDSYETLRKGGEHGDPIVPGKPEESLLYLKLFDPPPVGKQMPRNRQSLSEDDLRTIRTWIERGAPEE